MRKERKHYTGEEKVAILRRHLLDKVPVSDLCDELGVQPTVFYHWQKEFFENGAAAFSGKSRPDHQGEQPLHLSSYLLDTTLAIFQSLIVLSGVDGRRQRRATRKAKGAGMKASAPGEPQHQ